MTEDIPQKIVHVHLPKNEPFKTTLTAGKHQLIADEPAHLEGGLDQGPDPYDYLLMSLGSCTVITMKMYASRKKWELGDIFIELRHHKNHVEDCENCEKSNAKIDFIEKEIILKGELTESQQQKLLEISKKCPVHRTLLNENRIESTLSTSVT
ncbi:MAG: OsmC family protein [Balneolaceae bacterium]